MYVIATSRSCGCQDWVGPAAPDASFSEPDFASPWRHFHRLGLVLRHGENWQGVASGKAVNEGLLVECWRECRPCAH